MVVLVRCHDDSFAPALEANLNELVAKGLISAFLCNGKWISVVQKQVEDKDQASRNRHTRRLMSACI